MTLATVKQKFDQLVKELNNNGRLDMSFSTTVEAGYEALVLAQVMKEYSRIYKPAVKVVPPARGAFLNQKPGRFRTDKAFAVTFPGGDVFYFAADIEVYGLPSELTRRPAGTKFEADVVVIHSNFVSEVINLFQGYPGPQHLHSIYECKFGKYTKGQLRELLGLRRHISRLVHGDLTHSHVSLNHVYKYRCINSRPNIPINMVRPRLHRFFDQETANLFDLQQIVIHTGT